MAITYNRFVGLETGDGKELDSISGTPAFNYSFGASYIELSANGTFVLNCFDHVADAGDKQAIGFRFWTNKTTSGPVTHDLLRGREGATGQVMTLQVRQNGDDNTFGLIIRDANNALIAGPIGSFAFSTDYFIEVVWEHSASGTIEVFVDGTSIMSSTGEDLTDGSPFINYRWEGSTNTDIVEREGSIYIASGLTSVNDRVSNINGAAPYFEVFGYQNTVASAVPTAGLRATTKTNLDAGQWIDAGETPGSDAQVLSYDGSAEYGTVDLTGFGDEIDGDSSIIGINGIWRAEYSDSGGAAHFIGLGDSGDGDSAADQSVTLTTTPTEYFWFRTTDLPTKAQTIRQGMANESDRNLDFYEMWVMVAHVPAIEDASGEGVQTLGEFTQLATGVVEAIGSSAQTAELFTQLAIGVMHPAGIAAQTTALFTQLAAGREIFIATGAGLLQEFEQAASGVVVIPGAAQLLELFTQVGAGLLLAVWNEADPLDGSWTAEGAETGDWTEEDALTDGWTEETPL